MLEPNMFKPKGNEDYMNELEEKKGSPHLKEFSL
jgi:hypothetical protein